ncbi:MAG: PspA/IM30 family protein [Drouetiella hepatica Uher 2000/2452]|jgi:phage shock protein A|uniref:PspA/IM30 family protein n=1 Tax=Drouetiella hepatica Uher 2000/2452 TaxID=904376 RepID=A0A951ULQ9_9CYAN|nr:PspA/IM30 family protein [Drouetiella hepatica Uher 2000/2452]
MGLFDRIGRVVRANLNSMVSQSEDPEKILEQAVLDMQNDLIQVRQAVAQAIATQKRTERQISQSQATAEEWYRRAQLALQKNDETLAREALARRQSYQDTANALKSQIEQQSTVVGKLKQNMVTLESKLSEARTKKDMYIARARSAKASQQLNEMLDRVGTNNAMAAFDRMEERVLQLEAQSEAIAELSSGDAIEKQFKVLESGGNVDDELAALKAKLIAGDAPSLTASPSNPAKRSAIDDELEQLRAKLEES